jgi:hypothetical protein
MKNLYITICYITLSIIGNAQTADDALKFSWNPQMGTARNMAIGGTMIGLGGEISAAHSNPAGLGFFKNGEFVFSPGLNFGKNKIDYRSTNGQKGILNSNFNLGTSGVILAGSTNGSNVKSAALSLSINKMANFTNHTSYKGFNNFSSASEQYAEEFSRSKLSIDDAINSKFVSLATRMALYSYLIDTFKVASGGYEIFGAPEFTTTTGVNQESTVDTYGGVTELALGVGVNKNEKLFLGASFGLPITVMDRETNYKETDPTTNTNNGFAYYNYTENLNTIGLGFNAKFGLIYRPVERIRFGATIHTPTFNTYTETVKATMNTKVENTPLFPTRNLANTSTVTEQVFTNGAEKIENKYSLLTPWKIGVGASFVFRETENVKKQRAFIAADVEYVTNRTMQYSAIDEAQSANNVFSNTNKAIKDMYRNTFNFKVGGEVKFNTIMLRLGGAYFGNPNKEATTLKQNRVQLSGGLGYRHKGIFIDATYVHQMTKAVDFAYRLTDKANTFANIRNTTGMLMLTFGTKF